MPWCRIFSCSVHLVQKFIHFKSCKTFAKKTCGRTFNSMSFIKNNSSVWRQNSSIIITCTIKPKLNIWKQKMMIYNNNICSTCLFSNFHNKTFVMIRTAKSHTSVTFGIDFTPIIFWWHKCKLAFVPSISFLCPRSKFIHFFKFIIK